MAAIYEWPFDALLDYWFRVARARKAERIRQAEQRRDDLEVVE